MNYDMMWRANYAPGFEHLQASINPQGLTATGLVTGLEDERPFRVQYRLCADYYGRARSVEVVNLLSPCEPLHLLASGTGRWEDCDGRHLAELEGCIDIDLTVTPFTNTLPVRRLNLKPGQSRIIKLVYITAPQLQVMAVEQCYRCLWAEQDTTCYRFEMDDFQADIVVDAAGFVIEYPGLFTRVWSIPAA